MKRILIVDDEEQILKSLVRLFKRTDYQIITALDGENALQIMSKENIDLIISDVRMPKMDGYQLLCLVKEKYPKVFRIILSGYAEENLLFQALEKNIAKIYIFKPWINKEIIQVVDEIFKVEKTLEESDFLSVINNIDELPTIKSSYEKMISLIDNGAELKEICVEIEKDISIGAKMLHLANSACQGVKTGSINKAVTYLGIQNVIKIVKSTLIMDEMSNDIFKKEFEMLWKHSTLTNKVLIYIYDKFLHKKIHEDHSSAGILINVGKVLMYKSFHERYFQAVMRAINENVSMLQLEKELFNITHKEAGGYLLKWWELPQSIVEGTLFHHIPLDERVVNKELVCALHIADRYASEILKEKYLYVFNQQVFSYLNIEKQEFEKELSNFNLNY